jgi:hypothetical protein
MPERMAIPALAPMPRYCSSERLHILDCNNVRNASRSDKNFMIAVFNVQFAAN